LDTSGFGGRLSRTLVANQWYEPGIIASADGDLVDYVAWKPANRPTSSSDLPNNYDYYRAMGTPGKTWWVKTDASSNIIDFNHSSNGYMRWTTQGSSNFSRLENASSDDGNFNTVNVSEQAPPTKVNIQLNNVELQNDGNNSSRAMITSDNKQTTDLTAGDIIINTISGDETREHQSGIVRHVESQEIYWVTTANSSNINSFQIWGISSFKAVN
jgi:hypothetical protein